ncbi:hypothetical protein VF14_13705 [Nostoc linckia z18]|uniref:Uncharacterized protein n=2 Tax=Nostoc linckia TaxID=92942 RepID=A0A9Q5ZC50_NOSLI|nr:hypothetical protein [Nostoc linckia]PHK42234.1 hypothetical protein VF12_03455 [Nostoc linckia z15]PHK45441.1 hypothetical protein VF13_15910 [Nostoc linckia z16]PHJ59018.1 hypothetical protein VF02_25890 [Nostoc linckia z1]PHJ61871.1 hypothetical protein VF05_27590 [Nostoc linckia z3]PHJ67788.1 hypothetical protein VF03_25340 [Nostoc linckia z2]
MKKLQIAKLGLIATTIFNAIASSVFPAAAIPYNSATVYKAMDNGNTVVVFSATPGSRVSVNLGSVPKSTARIAGACGEVRISVPSSGDFTGLEVDGSGIDAANLPVQTLPSCVNGAFSEPRPDNFKTPSGQVVIVGLNPGAATAISLPTASTRSVTINACGFGTLKPTSTSGPLPDSFSVGTTNYTLATLPDATNAPYCRTVNGTPYGYVPASW